MSEQIVIVGCGGFGREVIEIIDAVNSNDARWTLLGILDDSPRASDLAHLQARGIPHLGPTTLLCDLPQSVRAVVAIGAPQIRESIDSANPNRCWATLIHPDATVAADAALGPGTIIAPGARVSTNVETGRHVHVDQNATIGHDCVAGDFVRLNPQACISGSVTLAHGCVVGANATVLQTLTIGRDSTVGAGAVVVRNVPAGSTVKGVPAR